DPGLLAANPAKQTGLMCPQHHRTGQHRTRLGPDDLLVMQNVKLVPDSLQHALAARGVPTIPSDVFGDGVVDRYLAERLIKLRALAGIIPMRLFDVVLAPIL